MKKYYKSQSMELLPVLTIKYLLSTFAQATVSRLYDMLDIIIIL